MRADDTVVGLVAVLRAAVWAGAPGTTLLADTAVRAVDTVARDDMDVVEEADDPSLSTTHADPSHAAGQYSMGMHRQHVWPERYYV